MVLDNSRAVSSYDLRIIVSRHHLKLLGRREELVKTGCELLLLTEKDIVRMAEASSDFKAESILRQKRLGSFGR